MRILGLVDPNSPIGNPQRKNKMILRKLVILKESNRIIKDLVDSTIQFILYSWR